MNRRAFLKYSVASTALAGVPATANETKGLVLTTSLEKHTRALSKKIRAGMKDLNVPGLSMVLIRESTPVWSESFGVQDLESKTPVTNDTVFEAASLTKPIFAYTVLKLVEQYRFDIDAPLRQYLATPYNSENPDWFDTITARHALTHATGFPNWRMGTKDPGISFRPGTRFSYSGEGFVYLQRVIEKLAEMPLDAWLNERLFRPLGMTSASVVWQNEFTGRMASGHGRRPRKGSLRKSTAPNAASSLVCSAQDYAKFVCALLKPPYEHQNLCSPATVQTMLSPEQSAYDGVDWGLGIGLQKSPTSPSFWHWGNNGGRYNAFFVGYPKRGLGAVVLTNSGNGLKLCRSIIPEAIGGDHPALRWPMVSI